MKTNELQQNHIRRVRYQKNQLIKITIVIEIDVVLHIQLREFFSVSSTEKISVSVEATSPIIICYDKKVLLLAKTGGTDSVNFIKKFT